MLVCVGHAIVMPTLKINHDHVLEYIMLFLNYVDINCSVFFPTWMQLYLEAQKSEKIASTLHSKVKIPKHNYAFLINFLCTSVMLYGAADLHWEGNHTRFLNFIFL